MTDGESITIKADEVLAYLNRLGYTNISATMLKEFLTDLKKLIKASHKRIVFNEYDSIDPFLNDQKSVKIRARKKIQRDKRFEKGIQTNVENCGCKPNNDRHISVHFIKKLNKEPHEHCIHVDSENVPEPSPEGAELTSQNESATKIITATAAATTTTTTSSKTSLKDGSSNLHLNTPTRKTRRDANAKPLVKTKCVNTCDPVALFHYYQSEWKKVKFPGVEHHNELRRIIREKLKTEESIFSARSSARRRECLC